MNKKTQVKMNKKIQVKKLQGTGFTLAGTIHRDVYQMSVWHSVHAHGFEASPRIMRAVRHVAIIEEGEVRAIELTQDDQYEVILGQEESLPKDLNTNDNQNLS